MSDSTGKPLISSSPATQATAGTAAAVAGALVVIVTWALSLRQIEVPVPVAQAMTVLVGLVAHAVAVFFMSSSGGYGLLSARRGTLTNAH